MSLGALSAAPRQHPQAGAARTCPAFLAGSKGRAGPKCLLALLHEEAYFNEAALGSSAFHLSPRWPGAVWLCWVIYGAVGTRCRCLSVLGDAARAGAAQPAAVCGGGPRATQKDPLEPALIRAGFCLCLGRKQLYFRFFSSQGSSSPVATAGSGQETCCLQRRHMSGFDRNRFDDRERNQTLV